MIRRILDLRKMEPLGICVNLQPRCPTPSDTVSTSGRQSDVNVSPTFSPSTTVYDTTRNGFVMWAIRNTLLRNGQQQQREKHCWYNKRSNAAAFTQCWRNRAEQPSQPSQPRTPRTAERAESYFTIMRKRGRVDVNPFPVALSNIRDCPGLGSGIELENRFPLFPFVPRSLFRT